MCIGSENFQYIIKNRKYYLIYYWGMHIWKFFIPAAENSVYISLIHKLMDVSFFYLARTTILGLCMMIKVMCSNV